MYQLVIYDTSNFVDFPIGGQLTSIRNFLRFVAEQKTEFVSEVLLVGVTNNCDDVGSIKQIEIGGKEFCFLPVLYRSKELNNVKKSLRIEYVKALFKYIPIIETTKNTVHYLHTPEAYIAIDRKFHNSKTAVFSHGSFFNMTKGFRFYNGNKIVAYVFDKFIIRLLRNANLIFALDETSMKQYTKYNKNVFLVDNSIVYEATKINKEIHDPIRLLFVGRLSAVKQIPPIIDATVLMNNVSLSVVGDGELKHDLIEYVAEKDLKISFEGGVSPSMVKEYMKDSDILVMNSVIEGKPMTIIEALSNGLPVITTPVGGIPDLVENHVSAEFTDGSTVEIMAAVDRIVKNYEEYSDAAAKSASRFDYKVVNEYIYRKLKELIDE